MRQTASPPLALSALSCQEANRKSVEIGFTIRDIRSGFWIWLWATPFIMKVPARKQAALDAVNLTIPFRSPFPCVVLQTSLNWMARGASAAPSTAGEHGTKQWHLETQNGCYSSYTQAGWNTLNPCVLIEKKSSFIQNERGFSCLNGARPQSRAQLPYIVPNVRPVVTAGCLTSSSRSFLKHRHAARFLNPSPSYVRVWLGLSFIVPPLVRNKN